VLWPTLSGKVLSPGGSDILALVCKMVMNGRGRQVLRNWMCPAFFIFISTHLPRGTLLNFMSSFRYLILFLESHHFDLTARKQTLAELR
jgi:hypothetical protein